MSNSFQSLHGKPTDLSNIIQGDDSNQGLNSGLDNIIPSNFGMVGGDNDAKPLMDSRNQGDHDATGKFNPYGDLPIVPTHLPGDPSFTRQTGPLMGGKHVDDQEENIKTGDSVGGSSFAHMNPDISKVEKRSDEPDDDNIGLNSTRGKLKMD